MRGDRESLKRTLLVLERKLIGRNKTIKATGEEKRELSNDIEQAVAQIGKRQLDKMRENLRSFNPTLEGLQRKRCNTKRTTKFI
ncbi:hypothetical protein N7517_008417 [Penicillium concentricum]|uniref:Uncharacterized protein n=1 Tax=Penicillium concentricum TaxID=293559 RepID=A0A9W9V441_9EURO|nr:uncharacterized protein N7517_008417 [Penicillium concentricum]KAJ5365531.1 hypothetical protein N7517_008417 [Penicillium concentricum]